MYLPNCILNQYIFNSIQFKSSQFDSVCRCMFIKELRSSCSRTVVRNVCVKPNVSVFRAKKDDGADGSSEMIATMYQILGCHITGDNIFVAGRS